MGACVCVGPADDDAGMIGRYYLGGGEWMDGGDDI